MYTLNNSCKNGLLVLYSEANTFNCRKKKKNTFLTGGVNFELSLTHLKLC